MIISPSRNEVTLHRNNQELRDPLTRALLRERVERIWPIYKSQLRRIHDGFQ